MNRLRLSFFALLLSGLPAQAPSPSMPSAPTAALQGFDGVWIADARTDGGTLWTRGADWKIGFTSTGEAQYLPYIDRDRHWPIGLRLLAARVDGDPLPLTTAAAMQATETRVRRAHGSVTELWDLESRAVRWSFQFDSLPRIGDLEVTVAADTALRGQQQGGSVEWSHGDSCVTCKDAIVFDAAGRSQPIDLLYEHGTLRLRVPRSFLAQAAWPVTLDPVMLVSNSFFASWEQRAAAFDPVTRTWLIAAVESGPDRDVVVTRIDEAGATLGTHIAEGTNEDAAQTDIAANGAGGIAIVAFAEASSGRTRLRTVAPADGSMGPTRTLSGTGAETPIVRLGGANTGNRFLVATRTMAFNPLRAVAAHLVDLTGTVVATGNVSLVAGAVNELAVSPLRAGQWGLSWGRAGANSGLAVDFVAVDAVESGNSPVISPILAAAALTSNTQSLTMAGEGERLVLATDRGGIVHGTVLQRTGGVWQVLDSLLLSSLEHGNVLGVFHNPRIICDGCRYSYSYDVNTSLRVATFRLLPAPAGVTVAFDETNVTIGTANFLSFPTAFASAAATGGPGARSFIVWQANNTLFPFAHFASYEARTPGATFTTIAVPCGTSGRTRLEAIGSSTLGGSFTLRVSREDGLPMILAGLPEATLVPLCSAPNSTCARGVRFPLLASVASNTLTIDVPCRSAFLGLTLAFQGLDLGATGGCSANLFGIPFRVTDTILATVR